MLSADELELHFHLCCLQMEIQNQFSFREFIPLPSVYQVKLLSLRRYFKRVFLYLTVWTPSII